MRLPLLILPAAAFPNVVFANCAPDAPSPRLSLMSTPGCLTDSIFQRQIAHPQDIKHPASPSPADTLKRVDVIAKWRKNSSAKDAVPDQSPPPPNATP